MGEDAQPVSCIIREGRIVSGRRIHRIEVTNRGIIQGRGVVHADRQAITIEVDVCAIRRVAKRRVLHLQVAIRTAGHVDADSGIDVGVEGVGGFGRVAQIPEIRRLIRSGQSHTHPAIVRDRVAIELCPFIPAPGIQSQVHALTLVTGDCVIREVAGDPTIQSHIEVHTLCTVIVDLVIVKSTRGITVVREVDINTWPTCVVADRVRGKAGEQILLSVDE